jgi:hypothetical protein
MFQTKFVEKIKKRTFYVQKLFISENRAVYNIEKYCIASQLTIWRMRTACCIPMSANTHSEYVIQLLIAFSRQKWLHERA